MSTKLVPETAMKTFLIILRDAVIACAIFVVIALVVNAVRSDGLPLVADKPYDIFVPCPEALGTVEMISPGDSIILDDLTFLIDARSPEEYNEWHLGNAMNITYDYLDPIPPEELNNIMLNITNSKKARLVIYGDGDGRVGSSGYDFGRELTGNGINNIYVVDGGADALKSQGK